jgi:hypothetical protein
MFALSLIPEFSWWCLLRVLWFLRFIAYSKAAHGCVLKCTCEYNWYVLSLFSFLFPEMGI